MWTGGQIRDYSGTKKKKLMTHLYKNKIKRHKMHFSQDKEQSNIKCVDLSGDPFTYLNDILHVEKYQMTKLACSVRSEDMRSREIQPSVTKTYLWQGVSPKSEHVFYIHFSPRLGLGLRKL